jgi:protein gp37
MSEKSTIEWTDASWNPSTGCTEVSPGCDHCYARTFAERFRGVKGHPYAQGFDLRLWPARLEYPVKWKAPRRIFVNSMSDLLHKDVPDAFILEVFRTMTERAPWHIYQVLTKRPSRLTNTGLLSDILSIAGAWPSHIWLGVSVETNAYRWRIEKLRSVPAPIRFLSCEPLLGPLDLDLSGIGWVIAGAESGHGARPMDEDWVRGIRDQCAAAGVAFFYKQNAVQGRKIPLPELDGTVWRQFPSLTDGKQGMEGSRAAC